MANILAIARLFIHPEETEHHILWSMFQASWHEINIWLFNYWTLHCVHQQLSFCEFSGYLERKAASKAIKIHMFGDLFLWVHYYIVQIISEIHSYIKVSVSDKTSLWFPSSSSIHFPHNIVNYLKMTVFVVFVFADKSGEHLRKPEISRGGVVRSSWPLAPTTAGSSSKIKRKQEL